MFGGRRFPGTGGMGSGREGGRPENDLYKDLGLTKDAKPEEIKSSYRKLSIKWHPDKNPQDPETAKANFQKISFAYNILSDPKKKEIYDKHGHQGLEMLEKGVDPEMMSGNPFGGFGFSFGGGFSNRAARGPQKCDPRVFKLRLSLHELYEGGNYKLHSVYKLGCEACEATGSASKKVEKCKDCNGLGRKMVQRHLGSGMVQMIEQPCGACKGKGQCADLSNPCTVCRGLTYSNKIKEIDFTVYPGMQYKMQIGLEGSGDELRDQIPGDLVVVILPPLNSDDESDGRQTPTGSESEDSDDDNAEDEKIKNTWTRIDKDTIPKETGNVEDNTKYEGVRVLSTLKRRGADLIYRMSIPLVNALTGLHYKIKHPATQEILLINHPEVIHPGSVFYIANKGMPELDQAAVSRRVPLNEVRRRYGNLIIQFEIIFPARVQKKSAEVLQAVLGHGLTSETGTKTKGKGSQIKENLSPVTLIPFKGKENDDREDDPKMMQGPQCVQQ